MSSPSTTKAVRAVEKAPHSTLLFFLFHCPGKCAARWNRSVVFMTNEDNLFVPLCLAKCHASQGELQGGMRDVRNVSTIELQ